MSETLNGTWGQSGLEPPDPTQRVERLDRDSSDQDRRQSEEFARDPTRHPHRPPPEEDRVEISDAARQALEEARRSGAPPPAQDTLSS